jgi:hypothetical protein
LCSLDSEHSQGKTPAEAVFGAQIVLSNEFFQNDELSVDTIVKKFSKTLHVSAPSLPRHNSSTERPAELLSAPLVWSVGAAWFRPFSCSTTAPTRFCAAAPAPSPSESGRGTRWLPLAALRLARPQTPCLAARVTATDRRATAQAVLPQPSGSHSQTRWSLHLLLLQRRHVTVLETFSYPARRFLHGWYRWRLHSLHRRGTRLIKGHFPRGWTSDLFSSQPRPELGGSPVESWLHPY